MSDKFFSMPPTPPRPTPILSPTTEEELLRYIREQRDARVGERLSDLMEAYMKHDAEDIRRHEELIGVARGHSLRIAQLEKDSGTFEAELSETTKNQIVELKEAHKWRDRMVVNAFVAIVISLFSGGVGALVSWFASRK